MGFTRRNASLLLLVSFHAMTMIDMIRGGRPVQARPTPRSSNKNRGARTATTSDEEKGRSGGVYANSADEWTRALVRNIVRREEGVVVDDDEGAGNGGVGDYTVSVSADGSTVAVGAAWADGAEGRGIRVYRQDQRGHWARLGGTVGKGRGDRSPVSAVSVSLSSDGGTVAVGGVLGPDGLHGDNGNNKVYPAVLRVYRYIDGEWVKVGQDIGYQYYDYSLHRGAPASVSSAADGELQSSAVSLSDDGKMVAIGEPHFGQITVGNAVENDKNEPISRRRSHAGRVRIFRYQHSESSSSSSSKGKRRWERVGDPVQGKSPGEHLGHSVALSADGNSVAVGTMVKRGLQGERYAGIAGGTESVTDTIRVYRNKRGAWRFSDETLLRNANPGGNNTNGRKKRTDGGGRSAGHPPPHGEHPPPPHGGESLKPNVTTVTPGDDAGDEDRSPRDSYSAFELHREEPIENAIVGRSMNIFETMMAL